MIWQIASATGWSVHHILWRINYQILRMMLSDAPHYEQRKKSGSIPGKRGMGTTAFFQSMLKQEQEDEQ